MVKAWKARGPVSRYDKHLSFQASNLDVDAGSNRLQVFERYETVTSTSKYGGELNGYEHGGESDYTISV